MYNKGDISNHGERWTIQWWCGGQLVATLKNHSSQFSSAVVTFYKNTANTELVNTEPLLLGEIQGSASLWSQPFHQLIDHPFSPWACNRKASVLPGRPHFPCCGHTACSVYAAWLWASGRRRRGRPSVLGMCGWNATATAAFLRAHQHTGNPGQPFLHNPGKLVVGDDPHPLGLHAAKYNLMNWPNSLLYLFSPRGSAQKETNTQSCDSLLT